MSERSSYPWFVRKDLDGFFGLAIDNLIQLMLIVALTNRVAGIPEEIIFKYILPGAAISIISGNIFYSIQARKLAMKTGRDDVTALPYGINTVSLFAYIFFIMAPVYNETKGPVFTWKIGLVACLFSGIIRNYWKASLWSFSAALLSYFGIIHAYTLTATGVTNRFGLGAAGEFAVCYAGG